MIEYTDSLDGINSGQLTGFFVGWPNPPSPETHRRILEGSDAVELAIDSETGHVVGFMNAISDGILSTYFPLLEVLPEYQHKGIGSELVRRSLERYADLYMVDLLCDTDLQPFYGRFGLKPATAVAIRRFESQSGRPK